MNRILSIIAVLLTGGACTWAQQLSRGHELLLDRGLQIQAQVFFGSTDLNSFSDYERWAASNFTTVNFQSAIKPDVLAAMPGGQQWGRWARDYLGTEYLQPSELPYAGSFVSFQYMDEQSFSTQEAIDTVAGMLAEYRTLYPDTLSFANHSAFIKSGAVKNYMTAADPDMVMYDYYPYQEGGDRQDRIYEWYFYNQRFRQFGLGIRGDFPRDPIPYGQYLSTFRRSYDTPDSSESQIRLNQFGAWVFGYSFVSAFVYNDTLTGRQAAMLFSEPGDHAPTPVFDYIAETNRQSLNLGPALVQLLNKDIWIEPGQHLSSGVLKDNSTPWNIPLFENTAHSALKAVTADNPTAINDGLPGDILVGRFEPLLADNSDFEFVNGEVFMIVNGLVAQAADAYGSRQDVRLDWYLPEAQSAWLEILSRDTGLPEMFTLNADGQGWYHIVLTLDGGTGEMFRLLTFIPEPGTAILILAASLTLPARRSWKYQTTKYAKCAQD